MSDTPHIGFHPTEEVRKRMSESHKGQISPMKGKNHTKEACEKISKSKKGKTSNRKGIKHSEKTREKMRKAHETRPPTSEETRGKMSESAKLKPPMSDETRIKLREGQKGERGSNWKGGISFEPYCPSFDRPFKERVRKFFGRVCVECGKTEVENG